MYTMYTFDGVVFCFVAVSEQTPLTAELDPSTLSLLSMSWLIGDSGMMVGSLTMLSDFSTRSVVASAKYRKQAGNNEIKHCFR